MNLKGSDYIEGRFELATRLESTSLKELRKPQKTWLTPVVFLGSIERKRPGTNLLPSGNAA